MRRGRRKKKLTPRLCSIWEYSVRTEKNTSAQKHITINTWLCNRGKHIQLWQAAIRSGAICCGTGHRPARQRGVQNGQRQFDRGRGVMSVIGEGTREVPLQRSSQGSYPAWPCPRECRYGGARKDKIELLCLWGEQLHTFTAVLSVHSGPRKHQFSLAKPWASSW